jgi:hypothetical protein
MPTSEDTRLAALLARAISRTLRELAQEHASANGTGHESRNQPHPDTEAPARKVVA